MAVMATKIKDPAGGHPLSGCLPVGNGVPVTDILAMQIDGGLSWQR